MRSLRQGASQCSDLPVLVGDGITISGLYSGLPSMHAGRTIYACRPHHQCMQVAPSMHAGRTTHACRPHHPCMHAAPSMHAGAQWTASHAPGQHARDCASLPAAAPPPRPPQWQLSSSHCEGEVAGQCELALLRTPQSTLPRPCWLPCVLLLRSPNSNKCMREESDHVEQ